MKLKRLIIHGFKSFKDKTVIHFDDGITGIVGPNGCGKSNIVDALFWVMGEQSAKHLRGSKMQDLIFSGSSKYSPASWAEVSLVLGNEEGKHIHIGQKLAKPSEIQITRKLYKNGETEYRINNFPCRLKDIHEVFMDTGAGAKSYSIIAQGEINRLVQAKPVERRAMIEEVAGVTKFKLRRKESVKKIENTQVNLDRLNDLQVEIYKQLKKLEVQAEKASRARTLKEKVKKHELIVNAHKEFDLLSSFRDLKVGSEDAISELEDLKILKNTIELTLEDERLKKDELTSQLSEMQTEFNEKSKTLAAAQERLNNALKNKDEKEKTQLRLEDEILEVMDHLESRKSRLSEVHLELESLENESFDSVNFEELTAMIEELQAQKEMLEAEVKEMNLSLADSQTELSNVMRELAGVEVKSSEYSHLLESLTLEVEEIEKETSSHLNSLSGEKETLNKVLSQRDQLKITISKLQEDHAQSKESVRTLEEELRVIVKKYNEVTSKLQAIKAVSASTDALGAGYTKFFETFTGGEAQRLGELIETDENFGTCVDSLLGEWLDAIVASDSNVDEWIQNNNELRLDVVKESTPSSSSDETIARLETLGAEEVTSVASIIKVKDSKWSKTLNDFLGGFYIIKNLDYKLMGEISSSINFKGLVSLDGRFTLIKNHGLVIKKLKGNVEDQLGFVTRNNQMRELEEQVSTLAVELEVKEAQLSELMTLKNELASDLENSRDQYNKVNSQYHGLKSAFEAKENFAGSSSNKLTRLIEKKSQTSIKKLELVEAEENFILKRDELTSLIADKVDELESSRERLESISHEFSQKREEFVSMKVQMDSFSGRKANIAGTISDLEREIERLDDKREANILRKEQLVDEYMALSELIADLEQSNLDESEILASFESALVDLKDEVASVLSGMLERENKVKESSQRINTLEKEIVVAQTRLEQIYSEEELLVRDNFERYQVDLREVISGHLELETAIQSELADISSIFVMENESGSVEVEKEAYEFEKRFPGQVKESREKYRRYKSDLSKLGEINWEAVEDYDRQKIRHDFLKNQEDELKSSLADLQLAIDHIDEKSKVRFKEAFEEVNSRFVKVFPIIFGGGSATLKLVGNIDDEECGIDIIAQPPGKKMQNINLMSGGEKAMTAVSLIFSIFLVKPSPFCLLDEVDAPLDDANVGRFNELLREMSSESQFILITHNKKTMELNDVLYGVTMQEPGISKAISVQLQ